MQEQNRAGSREEQLTGAGPRSQRGLESPGAEVGRCSLKDEGDRQGDKHGPLSTWWSVDFFGLVSLSSPLMAPLLFFQPAVWFPGL